MELEKPPIIQRLIKGYALLVFLVAPLMVYSAVITNFVALSTLIWLFGWPLYAFFGYPGWDDF